MPKYKAYPEYKDSGVEWLGKIPMDWKVVGLKNISSIINGSTPKSGVEAFWNGELNWITPTDLSQKSGDYIFQSQRKITPQGLNSCGTTLVPANSVILSTRAPIGSLAIGTTEFCTNQGCKSLIIGDASLSKFVYYYLSILTTPLNNLGRGSTFLELSSDDLGSVKISVPNGNITNIIKFLDHQTAKIDNLIEKQQQLIELLKEKRQAVISHAVTKGLNPDAPMKDSGVEWLGEVPEHWNISTLKHHAIFIDGDRGSEYPNDRDFVDNGVIFLSSKNISNWEINIDNVNYITLKKFNRLNRGKTKNGDLVVKVRGSTGRIGELAIFESQKLGQSTAFINAQMMIIRLKKSFNNFFLRNVAQGHYWMEQLNIGAYGTAQQQLNNTIFSDMIMVVPSINEQLKINKFLELETKSIDYLIEKSLYTIELMQERRTALISAAVTGKIDVRDWTPPAASKAATIEQSQEVDA
jgi:type I restriction enzyme S subunit